MTILDFQITFTRFQSQGRNFVGVFIQHNPTRIGVIVAISLDGNGPVQLALKGLEG